MYDSYNPYGKENVGRFRKRAKYQNQVLKCACKSTEHFIVFLYDIHYPTVYMQIHLSKKSFWKRLVYGIKYIFGYKSKYGAFDSFEFHAEHSTQLLEIIDHLTDENLQTFSYQ